MPTDKPRISFALTEDLLRQIDEYRYTHRVKNQSQAIIQLMTKGLEVLNAEQITDDNAPDELTPQELSLIRDFRSLNAQGKAYILQTMAMSVTIYKNENHDISDVEIRA